MSADDKARFYARTMHTPDDPARAEQRAALRELSRQLIPLHRALIDAAKLDYGANVGHIKSPGHLLQLLQEDPYFSWLKPLTSLIVDIDEMARRDFAQNDVDDIAGRAGRLFGATAGEDFSARYVPLLQRDIDVAAAHGSIRRILVRLAPPR